MLDKEDALKKEVRQSFEKVLNRHGYGFQYSVLRSAYELAKNDRSFFQVKEFEFPVAVQGMGTRIDFILLANPYTDSVPFYILAECKRANPALSNWCFVRTPDVYNERSQNISSLIMERFEVNDSNEATSWAKEYNNWANNPYFIGLEVRSKTKGESQGETGRAIEDACTQVSRGLNGFIETLSGNPQLLRNHKSAYLLPAIFTTAQLWGSDTNIAFSSLESGNTDLEKAEFKKLPWLCYQYHLSPSLKHTLLRKAKARDIKELMMSEYVRTIPIISPEGIENFFQWANRLTNNLRND